AAVASSDAGSYCVVVTGACNGVTNCATLTVNIPTTANGPSDLVSCPGESVVFATSASGTGPVTYQWSKDGVDVPGATSGTPDLGSVTATNAGTYCVVVTGPCNSVTNCASLSATDTTPPSVSCPPASSASANGACQ